MLQNSKRSNNAGIEMKNIRKKLMEYFTNKGLISWQQKKSLSIFKTDTFEPAPLRLYSTFLSTKNKFGE